MASLSVGSVAMGQTASFSEIQGVASSITTTPTDLLTNEVSGPSLLDSTGQLDPGWWAPHVSAVLSPEKQSRSLSLEQVIIEALEHSEQIKVFSELPLIRETATIEASAAFDWNHFLDTRFDDISEPIGNALTAGPGVNRFNDHQWTGRTGFNRRTLTGGTVEISQQFGFQDNNSQFFVPNPQGTARLVLGFTQPLLRGRGRRFNESLIVLAQIDKTAATAEFRRQTESHLLEVTRAYWGLYLERASYYQRINLYLAGKTILDRLEARASLDAADVQITAARASVLSRYSDLVRAKAAVDNAQARLRSLVNSPLLINVEVLPTEVPTLEPSSVDAEETIAVAFQHRPEVIQSLKQIKSAGVRFNMSRNELLPVLNLVTQTYLAGLEDQGDSLAAFGRQFDTGAPSYGIGLVYERPVGNRAAEARLRRRRLELRQIRHQYATTLENIRFEVSVGVNELKTSLQELSTKSQALYSQLRQLESLEAKWMQLPPRQNGAALALQDVLQTQSSVAAAESEFLTAQLTYNLSLVNLKRVTGTLLQSEQIDLQRYHELNLPTQSYGKFFIEPEQLESIAPIQTPPVDGGYPEVHISPMVNDSMLIDSDAITPL